MVKWTRPALRDLKNIHDYIADDSATYAKRVSNEIFHRATILNQFPRIGRMVPEFGDESVRELLIYSYRIIYHLLPSKLEVLAVIHARRALRPEMLEK